MALKQTLNGRMALTFSLTQALALLELPQIELASWILDEIEKNPLLELDSFPRSFNGTREIEAPKSLYDHLMCQIREHFPDPEEAIEILEDLDERGFISPTQPNSPTLSILQTFDPPGIFARNLKECLLLQLEVDSPAYKLVSLWKKPELKKAIYGLTFRPAETFRQEFNPPRVADLSISKFGNTWTVQLKDDALPKFHFRSDYLFLEAESVEEKELLRNWASSGKWVLRSLKRRKAILLALGSILARKQANYLAGRGELQPLSIQEIAKHLGLHESTLYRALHEKYAETPRGLLSLRSLVPGVGDAAKNLLKQLIAQENKEKPLSDAALVLALRDKGASLARRTVAKYRTELNIATASLRKDKSHSDQSKGRKEI